MNKLKAAWALAKFVAKFAWLAPLLAVLAPALGPLGPVMAGVAGAVGRFVKAAIAGTFENLGTWNRIAASLVWICVAAGVGIHVGIWATNDVALDAFAERDTWKAAHTKLIDDAKQARADNETKFRAAVAAAEQAAKRERETRVEPEVKNVTTIPIKRAPSVAPVGAGVKRSPDAKRVLPPAKGSAPDSPHADLGQGVFSWGLYEIFGPPLEPKPSPKGVGKLP